MNNWIYTLINKITFRIAGIRQAALFSALLLLAYSTTGQWINQSPVPTYLDVRGIAAPTTQRVFIATDDDSFDQGGALFESNDGGASWVQRDIPESLGNPLNGIFFRDSLNGWVYGNENYRTTDGGTTWVDLPFLGSTYFMEFYTDNFGLATGNFGQYTSLDSGSSWIPSPNGMFAFDFADDLIGLAVSDSAIYRTTDGGNSFSLVYTGLAEAVTFLSANVSVAIADSTFLRSTNGGLTWADGANAENRTSLLAVSDAVILAWGRAGNWPDYDDRVFRSTNGGQTWTDLGEVIPAGIYALTVVDPQTIVAADYSGNMFQSANAGSTWSQTFISPGPQPGYLGHPSPDFADAQTGYFGFGSGFIIKSTNGGASWEQISSGTGNSLYDIDRFPGGNIITIGEYGTILTSDGNSPWIQQESLSMFHNKAVHVIDANNAVLVNESGQVYKSTDGGLGWTAATGTPESLQTAEDIYFTSILNGWVIGQSYSTGALYRTNDGGNSWIPVEDFLGAYIAVDVVGSNIWAANVTGLFYHSSDNGNTWTGGEIPGSSHQITDMDFYTASTGYAVGWWGEAFRTNDGGLTWVLLPTPNSSHNFTDIYLLGEDELWLSTGNNVAYYSATGGQNWTVMNIGSAGFGYFNGITAGTDGNVWTVGYQGYIEHFQGTPPPPLNQPPVASFNFVSSGLTVDFTDTSTDPDGFIASWSWDFGDGIGSIEQNPSHTYDTANTYIITLTVTDDDDTTGSTIQIIAVQPNPGGVYGDFTEVTPLDSVFVTPQDEDFWVITTAPADYDSDGDLDIAVLGYYVVYNESVEYRLNLMRNDGPGVGEEWTFTYISVPLGDLTTGNSDMAWGDLDGDADLDLAIGTDGVTVIYLNNSGNLTLIDTDLPAYWEDNSQADFDLRSITWADYDNDSDLDLFIPSVWDDSIFSYRSALMRNEGSNGAGGWNFTEFDSVFAPTMHAQSAWADYDGDQDLDMLLVSIAPLTDESFIQRYRNDSNGVFVGENILGSLTVEHGEAQWGDYDGDGDLDILVAGSIKETDGTYNPMALRIYNNNNETYSPFEVIACIPCEGWFDITAATWADYDSDGDMDILLAGNYNSGSQIEGRARIYTNDGGIFTDSGNELPAPRASGDRGGTFSWLDIDGDGDLDYFIAGQYFVPGGNGLVESQMHLYRNDTPGQNFAPMTATQLDEVQLGENTVLLSWLPGSDDHTPEEALTYDLELFRENVPVTLPKRSPEPGNISAVNEWLLTGLELGTYQYTLRTVDAAYIGSSIVTGEFVIETVSVADNSRETSTGFSVDQNYPNPFRKITTIRYSLKESGNLMLKVYNMTGEEVKTITGENMQPGSHNVMIDANDLPPGVYFYKLQSGNNSMTRKMIISGK